MSKLISPWLETAKGARYREARVFYSKTGRAKYISHLDITRCMQRAIQRAGLSVWYTEGFNPHIYLTFALPLPLGYESVCEVMDLRFCGADAEEDTETLRTRLNAALPPDLRVERVEAPQRKPEEITTARYEISISAIGADGAHLRDCFLRFWDSGTIEVEKHTKKGVKTIDIRPEVEAVSVEAASCGLTLVLLTSAGTSKNINPTLLTEEFLRREGIADALTQVLRTNLLCTDSVRFE